MNVVVASILVVLAASPGRAGTFVYVSLAADKKIAVYSLDPKDGKLTFVEKAACEGEPAALIADPTRTFLFASLRAEGKLSAFRIDPATGKLTAVNTVEAGPDPAHISTSKDGRFLLAAYYVAAKVTVHAIGKDGASATSRFAASPPPRRPTPSCSTGPTASPSCRTPGRTPSSGSRSTPRPAP